MTVGDVAPDSGVPATQERTNPAPVLAGAVPSVLGLPPILVAIFGLVGALVIFRALTHKG